MKIFFTILLFLLFSNVFSQQSKSLASRRKANVGKPSGKITKGPIDTTVQAVEPHPTITDKYLKGPERPTSNASASTEANADSGTFASGIYAAQNTRKKVDTSSANPNRSINNAGINNTAAITQDTVYNQNTIIQNGITTTSGAVDRSGQTQFGQTNWGSDRSTVGESQWTVPPPVSASFIKEFPTAGAATWSRSKQDSSIYSARYKTGVTWITSNYNAHGERLDMRTEVPSPQASRPISIYLAKQPADFEITTVSRLQVLGKPDMYEIQTKTGKTIYINNDGIEVNY